MNKLYPLLLLLFLVACTSSPKRERPAEWQGEWTARWETLPESYPGVEDMQFYMNGNFLFSEDRLTITSKGFKGCIFHPDTTSHTQSWYISSDTLFVLNGPDALGLSYLIKSRSDDQIELQLLEDIFITLTRN